MSFGPSIVQRSCCHSPGPLLLPVLVYWTKNNYKGRPWRPTWGSNAFTPISLRESISQTWCVIPNSQWSTIMCIPLPFRTWPACVHKLGRDSKKKTQKSSNGKLMRENSRTKDRVRSRITLMTSRLCHYVKDVTSLALLLPFSPVRLHSKKWY